jgi:hypothetical protein
VDSVFPENKIESEEKDISLDQDKPADTEGPVPEEEKEQNPPLADNQLIEKPDTKVTNGIGRTYKKVRKISEIVIPNEAIANEPEVITDAPVVNGLGNEYHTIPRSRRNIVIWVIVIVLVNTGIIYYFFRNNNISDLFTKNNQSMDEYFALDTVKTLPDNITPSDTTFVEEPEKKEVQEIEIPAATNTEKVSTTSGTRFYIVAGVFREEKNALNFVSELKSKGYNSQQFGKIGTSFAVSYSVFSTKIEAEKELIKIKKETDPAAWIKVIE